MLSRTPLGQTDLVVSTLCYGTNMLGWMLDQSQSDAILDTFAALGGNFIDTARSYGDWAPDAPVGASERAVGAWLKHRRREDFVIATKGGFFDLRAGDYRPRVTPSTLWRNRIRSSGTNTIPSSVWTMRSTATATKHASGRSRRCRRSRKPRRRSRTRRFKRS